MTDKPKTQKITIDANTKLDPQEIVMNNAAVLAQSSPEDAVALIREQLNIILEKLESEEGKPHFTEDVTKMIPTQIALASLSIAIDYWVAKLRKGKIKIYGPEEMPKA